jgi:uncharacterized SAM-binding protein YcdF (DUF218 family)
MADRFLPRHRDSEENNGLQNVRRWLIRILATIGLITVLVMITPIDGWWARMYSGPIEQPKGDVLIVLSAAADDHGLISFSSYWRTRYALLAWRSGGFQKIVVTGGGGPGIVDFLVVEGVPREDIVAEWKSMSTRENAINTAQLVHNMPGKKVLLTSDFHMYRAIRLFRKAGVDVTPMPVPDVLKASEHVDGRFAAFQSLVVESTKIIYYRLHGWI